MSGIAAFLRARLDEEADTARAALAETSVPWSTDYTGERVTDNQGITVAGGDGDFGWPVGDRIGTHIARQDPQATLDRVEALRGLVQAHADSDFPYVGDDGEGGSEYSWEPYCDRCHKAWPCPTLRALAYAYRRQPGWEPRWAPEGVEVAG